MDTTEDISRFAYVSCAALTDVGRKRKNNEDNYGTFQEAGVFCVADGMGGARDGEVASRIVVEHLAGALKNWDKISPPIPMEDRLALVDKCLDAASLWINQYAASHNATGCGTTFVGVVLDPGKPGHAVAVHAGDSRLYRIHRNKITQITCDHSVANMTGVKNENELNPVFRNMILRAVGIKPTVELERTSFEMVKGDWILICSDGLTKMVDDKSIAKIVAASEGGKAAVNALVTEANRCGGRDNITVVLLHFGELPPALPVHARLTESEFLTCMGVATSETSTTTETAFTAHTGTSSTEPNALNAGHPNSAAANAEGWLSDDEDSDNTPVPVVADGDDGNGGEVRSTKYEGQRTKEDGNSGCAADSSDADTKTTEDIPPAPEPAAVPCEARTTEEMPPPVAGRRMRKLVSVFIVVAVLAVVLGMGSRILREVRIAALEKARLAEEARLAAIAGAETDFTAEVTAALLPLHDLPVKIQQSKDPESYSKIVEEARTRLDYAWEKAVAVGVTNQARYAAKQDSYKTLSTKVVSAIADRRRFLDAEAERIARIAAAETNFTNKATSILAPLYGLATKIADGEDPESFTNVIAEVRKELDAAWENARKEAAVNLARYTEKKVEYTTLSDVVAKAISTRRDRLDAEGECNAKEREYNRLAEAAAGIAAHAAYEKALGDIDKAVKGLPLEAKYEDLRGRFEDLRVKYGKLMTSISAPTAKIVVKNEGEVPLSVTFGDKTEMIEKGGTRSFGDLGVWKEYALSAKLATPAAADFTLDPASRQVCAKGPGSSVTISFAAKYKGDPRLVVRNDNDVAIKVNGVEIKPQKTHALTGPPRSNLSLQYACDNPGYVFADGAGAAAVRLGNAGERKEISAPALTLKEEPAQASVLKEEPAPAPVLKEEPAPAPAAESVAKNKSVAESNSLMTLFGLKKYREKNVKKETEVFQSNIRDCVRKLRPRMEAYRKGEDVGVDKADEEAFRFAVKFLRDERRCDMTEEHVKMLDELKKAGW